MRRGTIASVFVACALVIVFASCKSSDDDPDCSTLCGNATEVTIELSCAAEVTSATLTGPCAPGSAEDPYREGYTGKPFLGFFCDNRGATPFVDCSEVSFETAAAGDCHVEIDFADGFTYSGDVTYTAEPQCCPIPFLSASPPALSVNNPASSCIIDAGTKD
jgi:hypothetical protein